MAGVPTRGQACENALLDLTGKFLGGWLKEAGQEPTRFSRGGIPNGCTECRYAKRDLLAQTWRHPGRGGPNWLGMQHKDPVQRTTD